MTRYKYEIIPDFDVLKWKQEVQMEIYETTKDMTSEEVREYFRKGSEEFQKEIAAIRARKQRETAVI